MANNNTTVFNTISNNVLLCSVMFKLIAMIIGVLGNVTVLYTIFLNREKTATSYLVGNLALADLLLCITLYPIWTIDFIQIILTIDIATRICFVSLAVLQCMVFCLLQSPHFLQLQSIVICIS